MLMTCSHTSRQTSFREYSHSNPLVVETCKYAPHPYPLLRRPHSVLLDPDDPITAASVQYIGGIYSLVSQRTLRRRKRRRGQSYLSACPHLGASVEIPPDERAQSILIANSSRASIKARFLLQGRATLAPSRPVTLSRPVQVSNKVQLKKKQNTCLPFHAIFYW